MRAPFSIPTDNEHARRVSYHHRLIIEIVYVIAIIAAIVIGFCAQADTVTAPGVLKSGVTYTGDGNTIAGVGSLSIPAKSRNVTLKGIKLNGIYISVGEGSDGIRIDGCTVLNVLTGPKAGIVLEGNVASNNVVIVGNRIDNCPFRGFWGNWNLGSGFILSDNTFTRCGEGAQGTWAGPFKNAGYIGYNEVSGHTRHGLEFQYQYRNAGLEGVTVENNWIHDWTYGGGPGSDASSIGISAAIGGYLVNGQPAYAKGIVIQNNFIDGSPSFVKAIGQKNSTGEIIDANWFVGVEAMGEGTLVWNNVIRGYRHGVEVANINAGIVKNNVCAGDVAGNGTNFIGAAFFKENGNGFDWGNMAEVSGNTSVAYEAGLPKFNYGPRVSQTASDIGGVSTINPLTVTQTGSSIIVGGTQDGATVRWRLSGPPPTAWQGMNTFAPAADWFDHTWRVQFQQTKAGVESAVVEIQLKPVVVQLDATQAELARLQVKIDAIDARIAADRVADVADRAKRAAAVTQILQGVQALEAAK